MLHVKVSEHYHVSRVCRNDRQDPFVDVNTATTADRRASSRPAAGRARRRRPRPRRRTIPTECPTRWARAAPSSWGIPLTKPPYAQLVAVDLNKGEIAWKRAVRHRQRGDPRSSAAQGRSLPERLGTAGQPGVLVTRGGLVFVGGGDPYLVRVRQEDRARTAAGADAVPDEREPDDLQDPIGPAVRCHRDRGVDPTPRSRRSRSAPVRRPHRNRYRRPSGRPRRRYRAQRLMPRSVRRATPDGRGARRPPWCRCREECGTSWPSCARASGRCRRCRRRS